MSIVTQTKPIYNGAQVIGEVKSGTFRKSIFASRHMLRQPPAISLSVDSLRQAEAVGAQNIEVKERESGLVYSCTLTHFRQYSFDLQRGGFESQKALCLKFWNVSGGTSHVTDAPKHSSTDTPAPEYAAPTEIQLSLFAK